MPEIDRLRRLLPVAAIIATAGGCGMHAEITVTPPIAATAEAELKLSGKWAYFDRSPQADRILLAFAHPGAMDGTRQYFLYLRLPCRKGEFRLKSVHDRAPLTSESQDHGAVPEAHGFYLQRAGKLAGITDLVSGTLRVGGLPFDGGKRRRGRLEARCADGSTIIGRFTARQNRRELIEFEQDRYPGDVQALTSPLQNPKGTPPDDSAP